MARLTWIFLSITCILLLSVCEGKVRFFDRLKSPKCSQSKSCPPEGNYDLRQILCDYSCLDGNSYTCLEHGDGEYILEFCSPQLQCEPGERGVFTIDDNDPMKVKMTETSCPPDRYQREISDCIDACNGNRNDFSYLPDMFIVYSNGSLVSPPEVYCNYTGGYYSPENITLFYFDKMFKHSFGTYCKHVSENDPCVKGWMPLQNGTCVQPCMKGYERDDHDSFVCKPHSGIAQCKRSMDNIKTMYKNTKARAKSKESEKKKTGGGPYISLTQAEEEIICQIKDKPQMVGISEGLETSTTLTDATPILDESSKETESEIVRETTAVAGKSYHKDNADDLMEKNKSIRESGKGTKRKRMNENDELYNLEVQRSKLEIQLLQNRIEQEKEIFKLKIQNMIQNRKEENELYNLKSDLLTSNITNALNHGTINIEQ